MRVLVLGGNGQVASAVAQAVPAIHRVTVLGRAKLDITDQAAVCRALEDIQPDWIVNGAAYTAVDLAEDERAQAIAVNDMAVGVLETEASRAGCRLLHLSTDFVFDGRSNRAYVPTDKTNPLSAYGVSKRGGEIKVLEGAGTGIVLRTAWVYSASGKNFVLTMLRLMAERDNLTVVSDQIGTPTWAASLASAIWGLIDAAAPGGIYHWADLGVASWYDFAVAIQEEAQARRLLTRAIPITPIASRDYPTRAERPAFSVLDSAATHNTLNRTGRHWRHNLRIMLDELRAA